MKRWIVGGAVFTFEKRFFSKFIIKSTRFVLLFRALSIQGKGA